MKLYRIRDWSTIYENNRTRELKRLDWVPIPNNHDGDGYTILVTQPDGAALLGAWVALVQVASKCDPRGTLLRRSRTPHDAGSLARITRLPEEIFNRVFDVSINLCKWLEVEDLQQIPQDTATIPQDVAPRVRARVCALREGNGREGKGIEEKGTATLAPTARGVEGSEDHPKWEQIRVYVDSLTKAGADYTEAEAKSSYLALQAGGWMWGRRPIADYRAAVERQMQSDRNHSTAKPNGHKPHSIFELKQIIEAKSSLADSLKHKHCADGALSSDWSSTEAKSQWRNLRQEIKTLTAQIAAHV